MYFADWQNNGKSIYNTEEGIALSLGDFHSGSVFEAEIKLDDYQAAELANAIQDGYQPVFTVFKFNT